MAKIIVTANPLQGHFAPLAAIASDLTKRGHEVLFYTSARYAEQVRQTGARFAPFPAAADLDTRDLAVMYPEYDDLSPFDRSTFDLEHLFFGPAPLHDARLRELLAGFPAAVVIGELSLLGTLPMALRAPRHQRPLLVQIGIAAPTFDSVDAAPYGPGLPPPTSDEERAGYAEIRAQTREMFAVVQKYGEEVFRSMGVELPDFFLNAWATVPDHYLQLTVAAFEYPRGDAPEGFRLIGPVPSGTSHGFQRPAWWTDLTSGRPVVVVTQGTLANNDLSELVIPTIQALADADVTVVAATARPDGCDIVRTILDGDIPGNVHLAGFVPFDELLPLADVLVTNAGYGGVHTALRHGVPLVVAGETEDKPEVAARVEWSGTGVNLRTGRPETMAVRTAVDTVLNQPSYRERARALQGQILASRAFDTIAEIVEQA
ncbi:nucleotide disphospho-sugar-binding domain-containing protein [Streptomyces sp. NPDC026673]|uniref:nucleotide disphospho-sugar-binding domain-containing protein n=1 Tax=Streptomyces sp. NPDC026673 TaxID=3155724 RepID=UPI0033CF28D1